MLRNIVIGIIILIFIVLVSAIIQAAMRPKPFYWEPTYSNISRQPFGTYIFFNQLKDFFPGKKVKRLSGKDIQPYIDLFKEDELDNSDDYYDYDEEYGDDDTYYAEEDTFYHDEDAYYEEEEYSNDQETEANLLDATDTTDDHDSLFYVDFVEYVYSDTFNFLFLNEYFDPDEIEFKSLLQHVYLGNSALICAYDADESYLEYLNLGMVLRSIFDPDSAKNAYTLSDTGGELTEFKSYNYYSYFETYPDDAQILIKNKYDQVVALSVPIGEGELVFFCMPIILTNYNILKRDRAIVSNLLSNMPLENTYWAQNFYGNYAFSYPEKRSVLGFIHSEEALTWAFYTLLFALLVYFLFQVKRRQRTIPVINPPENTSVKFLETLSNLYMARRDYKDLLTKKMNYFLMQVRDKFHLDTHQIDEDFMKRLSHKSNVKLGVIKLLFYRYETSMKQPVLSADDFSLVNKLFQDFKHLENG